MGSEPPPIKEKCEQGGEKERKKKYLRKSDIIHPNLAKKGIYVPVAIDDNEGAMKYLEEIWGKEFNRQIGGKGTIRRKLAKPIIYSHNKPTQVDVNVFHAQVGHGCFGYLAKRAARQNIELTGELLPCRDCQMGKGKRTAIPKRSDYIRSTKLLGRVYADLTGPFRTQGIGGARYMLVFVDDYSRKKWTYLLKSKEATCVLRAYQRFENEVALRYKKKIEILRSDNGEFDSELIVDYLCSKNVWREYTSDYTPQQNAVVEVAIRDIKNKAIVFMNAANLKETHAKLWPAAVLMATEVMNDDPCAANKDKLSPNEVLGHPAIPLNMSYAFGSMATIIRPNKLHFENKSEEAIFIGYCKNKPSSCLRFMKLSNREIVETQNYTILQNTMLFNPKQQQFTDTIVFGLDKEGEAVIQYSQQQSLDEGMTARDLLRLGGSGGAVVDAIEEINPNTNSNVNEAEIVDEIEAGPISDQDLESDVDDDAESIDEEATDKELIDESLDNLQADLQLDDDEMEVIGVLNDLHDPKSIDNKMPKGGAELAEYSQRYYGTEKPLGSTRSGHQYQAHTMMLRVFVTHDGSLKIPKSYKDVYNSVQKEKWLEAIKVEYDSLVSNGTWDLVDKPDGAPVVGCRWVFSLKYNTDGTIKRFKARLVVQGFSQTQGVDYFETFAPVVNFVTLRMILSLATKHNWDVHQLDFETAFLNSDVDETIYMKQPPGFEVVGQEGKVYLLRKSLYGLKQAPRNWSTMLSKFLLEIGLTQDERDPCLFVHHRAEGSTMLCVYVDDLIVTGSDSEVIAIVKDIITSRFKCKELGDVHQLLGMIIDRDRVNCRMRIHQQTHITKMLEEFSPWLEKARTYNTPASENTYNEYVAAVFDKKTRTLVDFDYRSAIGCLLYISLCSRPDIACIVRFLSSFVTNWIDFHVNCILRVMKYLEATQEEGLFYTAEGTDLSSSVSSFKEMVKEVEAYSDASWADIYSNATSTGGKFIRFLGNVVHWSSTKQKIVARSSMESEYIAMSACVDEIEVIVDILKSLGGTQTYSNVQVDSEFEKDGLIDLFHEAVRVRADNTASICIGNQTAATKRSRHINVKFHNVKQAIANGLIKLEYVKTKENIADMFTKCLGGPTFHYLKQFIIG